jgi:hypothetical protein
MDGTSSDTGSRFRAFTACRAGLAPFFPPRHSFQNMNILPYHYPRRLRCGQSPQRLYRDLLFGMALRGFWTPPYSFQSSPRPVPVYPKAHFPSHSYRRPPCQTHLLVDYSLGRSFLMPPIRLPLMRLLPRCLQLLEQLPSICLVITP